MNKIIPQTKDITTENINKIALLFPQVITEKEDKNGNTIKAIDFELLKQHLSKEIVEGADERYRLDWPGKRASILKANTPIDKTLKPDRESSVNFNETENVYIEGDNFEVLKILQESYLGKIKMIYIDPPYNTGKDFVYKDNFKVSKDEYEDEIGTEDEEGGKLFKNTDTNGRFHSDWLSMMYERLLVARDLLTDDGVIFMSIGEDESHNLRKIADEIFGEENFQTEITWQKRYTRSNNTIDFTTVVESILVYSKSENFLVNLLPRTNETDNRYTNPDKDIRGDWKGASFLGPVKPSERPNLCYPIENPYTGSKTYPTSNAWRRSENEFHKLQNEGKLYWGKDNSSKVPSIKMFLSEARGLTPTNFWNYEYAGNTDLGTKEVEKLFDLKVFDFPKPSLLMKRILEHSINNNDLVLDFFSGSATTAHATMQLNAEDGGNRKFIMVQIPEETDEKSEVFKAGYKTITEIGKERIRRAGKKILEENTEKLKERETPLDVGFRVYKTSESILKDVAKHPNEVTQTTLFESEDNIRKDASSEDILTAVLLDFSEKLDHPIEKQVIANSEIFIVDTNALVACFDTAIDMQVVDAMAKMQPIKAVFRDACFIDDKDLINTVESRFKQLAPNTKVHVI
ncbi:Type III restriction-modification system methylation subunit [Tenacibaculum dicentrarchi]|uniref:site-specific DNA-methyltransferase (adenine-specific) n=1 Tax=Tenacibaculum dicentrarchi TaxID=669041 RepID=A0ABM9NV37_9FLAO|nr:Type III restriction-modification system methylation subunit [Tenacibaculum dicentrarchi]